MTRFPREATMATTPRRDSEGLLGLAPEADHREEVTEFRRSHLLYFVTVAEEQQMTRAAKKLHLAQPALSQAIALLESDLGIELFERHARGVRLTPAGEALLPKARASVSAWSAAEATAQSLARARAGTVEFGFVGSPPGLDSPAALEAFTQANPEIELRYRELPFPTVPSASWLADVDVAVCHRPPHDPAVWAQPLRDEPRAVLVSVRHPLAEAGEVSVADVLGETFIGIHPSVDPEWAGFWSLDDHRGGPPEHVTPDHAANPQEVLAAIAVREAITTVPASVALLMPHFLTGVAALPLRDAAPSTISLVGRRDRLNPLVEAVRSFARRAFES
jgi:DNA-binding transcriptional LysR family regulator